MSYPYRKNYFDNSRDSETIVMTTQSVKPNYDYQINPKHLTYNAIGGSSIKNKDPSKIKINWDPVIGYDSIKNLINAVLKNKNVKKTHLLIAGSPGTSKTVFLKTIEQSLLQQSYNVH